LKQYSVGVNRIVHERVSGAIEVVCSLAFDAHKTNRVVKSAYDAMIAVCICQLVYMLMANQNKTSELPLRKTIFYVVKR